MPKLEDLIAIVEQRLIALNENIAQIKLDLSEKRERMWVIVERLRRLKKRRNEIIDEMAANTDTIDTSSGTITTLSNTIDALEIRNLELENELNEDLPDEE